MKDPNKLWTDLCKRFAEQSTCLSRKVGCIIVKDSVMIAEGWNSPARGTESIDCMRCTKDYTKGAGLEHAICAHAESNAIGHCARRGISTVDAEIYCTHFCCKYCADLICAAGIKKVHYIDDYPNTEHIKQILRNASVEVIQIVI